MIRIGRDVTSSNVVTEDGALEDAVGGFRLIGRHFMPRLIDSRKGEVAILADLPTDIAGVYLYWSVPSRTER